MTIDSAVMATQTLVTTSRLSEERRELNMERIEQECFICDCHIIWESTIAEELDCQQEPSNVVD